MRPGSDGDCLDFYNFFHNKTVLITGHTGFKGSWLCKILIKLGANVIGYSLQPPTNPNLYNLAKIENNITSIIHDIEDLKYVKEAVRDYDPQIVIHMAAQPLVGVGYSDPVLTYRTNVMGTVNILESIRDSGVVSFVNVTTDKVYYNKEWAWGYREYEQLNGYDPYSNSKSCSELVTSCYSKCFFDSNVAISTLRAGNVIGGGDFTNPRIIPDCVRAAINNNVMVLRNPYSTRPYQYVLEPLFAYLLVSAKQYNDRSIASSYNVGPDDNGCINNESLVELFKKYWGDNFSYIIQSSDSSPHEANYLKLDSSKIKSLMNWHPVWSIDTAVQKTVEWTKEWYNNGNISDCMNNQINQYLNECDFII